ncbi:armadillo-type protein [Sporodiniella umbellata]|nr:armadillo-type protein [Sporodiniella umbellata]
MVTDANAVAQEAALTAILEYVSNAPNASNSREEVIPSLVEKCFGAAKAGTKQKATDIVLLYAEVDQPDAVIEFVIPGTTAKQPKVVTQTVVTLKELVRQFGAKKVSPKPIIKLLPKLFGHTDKNVRAETFTLTVETYRWIGQPMMNSLSDLKPVQLKELEEAFQKLPAGKPTPERYIRSEQAAQEEEQEAEQEQAEQQQEEEAEPEEEMDPFDLADPVDITDKLPGNFYELLASKKWQERREALDALLAQAKTPKILDKDYTELMGALAKRINDANVLLVGVAANCVQTIAEGLRLDFGKYKPVVAPPMIEKLKERKPAILEQLANALNAVFASLPLSEVLEDITAASKHKNPQVRSECFKLVSRRLREIKEIPGKTEIKAFGEMFKKLLDDADANARESGAEGLGTMMKMLGEKVMLAFTDGLDDIKMGKIKEVYEKVTVKAKAPKKAAPPPPVKKPPPPKKAPAKAPAKPKSKPKQEEPADLDETPAMAPPKRKPPARLVGGGKKAPPSKPKPAAVPGKKPAKLPAASAPEEIKYRFSQEDAEARATEYIPETIHSELQESAWKIRLAAMESLCTHFESEEADAIEPEIVIRSFSKKPGWKEMNFQVMGKMFYCIQILATECPKFTKACAALCMPVMVEKLGDIKLKKPAGECLVVMAEKISLQFVLSQAYPVLKAAKSPKVLSDSLLWIHSCLMDFGIFGLQIRDLIDLVKFALGNTNAAVRTSAVTVMGALRQYIGPEVKSFIDDVSPALLANIETEFEKVSKMDPPQPSKGPAINGDTESGDGGNTGAGAAEALESLFPRVDISGPLNKTIAECGDSNWKVRKEGLDKVQSILAGANNRIKPSLGAEFPGVLKQRLNDSNKNLQIQAVEITGLLAIAMDKPFEKYAKTFAAPVVAVLTDNKANVRAAGIATLENFRKACGLESLASSFGAGLANESPALRKDLLAWLNKSIASESKAGNGDWSSMIGPTFSCLQDRNADVRKQAQVFLPLLVSLVGYDPVARKATEMKPAQRQTIMPLIESARGSAPAAPSKQIEKTASSSRTKTIKKKIGLPSPRPVSQASSASEPESLPPALLNESKSKLARTKKEVRRSLEPSPSVVENLPEEEEPLPSLNSLPRLKARSQIGKPRGLVAPQRISHHVPQSIPEPEPMEDLSDDYGAQRMPEPAYTPPHEARQMRYQAPSMQYQHPPPAPAASLPAPAMNHPNDVVSYLIGQITGGDPQASIEALKQFDKFITQNPTGILPYLESLIHAVTHQVRLVYSSIDPRQPASTRLCKHLVNALVLLFSNRELASAVSQDALYHLLQELAHRLLDQKMLALESGPQLSKALNVAMVKILENSKRNVTFSALLSILATCSSDLRPGDSPAAKETKYTELIMKCLWKLAKTIREALHTAQLNPDELLYEINQFFIMTPPTEWKRRATEHVPLGEMPLRTVKTLLLELVTGLGDSIFQHLTLIEDPQKSSVYPYLHHMLEACRKKGSSIPQQPASPSLPQTRQISPQIQTNEYMSLSRNSSLSRPSSMISVPSNPRSSSMASHRSNEEYSAMHTDAIANGHSSSTANPSEEHHSPRSNTLNEIELNNALQVIFSKIGTRDQTKQGIAELYEFQKAYPLAQTKVNTYLGQTGTYFQSYIRRGLSNLAAEDNETHAASPATIPATVTPNTVHPVTPSAPLNSAASIPEETSRYSVEPSPQPQASVRTSVNEGRPPSYAGGKLYLNTQ